MKNKSIYWMALFSFVLSLITIILFFFKVEKNSIVNSDTFISACTAIITIGVTIAVGFQVFQSLDIKSKISNIDTLKQELKKSKEEFHNLSLELKSQILLNESDRKYNENDIFTAIIKLQEAIDLILRSDKNKSSINTYIDLLNFYVSSIDKRKKHQNTELDKVLIDSFKVLWRTNTIQLKHNPYYWAISNNYEEIEESVTHCLNNLNHK